MSQTTDSSTDPLRDIAIATHLQEGREGVAQVIRLIGSGGKTTLKDLSHASRIPVPVLAALRREMELRGILSRDSGIALSPEGEGLLRGLGGVWTSPVCSTCEGTGMIIPDRYENVLRTLRDHWAERPGVDVRLDQSFALPESNLRRCLFALANGGLLGKHVLFLGDDDAGSIAASLLARELGSKARVTALDVDRRVLNYIRSTATNEGLEMETIEHDVRQPLPNALTNRFQTVLTDPPYTIQGLELFLSRAIEATGTEPGRQIFLSFGHKPPAQAAEALQTIAGMGLVLRELRPGFNVYEGADVLGNRSDLYHLAVTRETRSSVHGGYRGAMYTGEIRPRTRQYICKECGAVYQVESGGRWETIEDLKAAGCERCGAHSFEQKRRKGAAR